MFASRRVSPTLRTLPLAAMLLLLAAAQQAQGPLQTLVINYPNSGVKLTSQAAPYRGLVYVKIFPVSPELIKANGSGPIAAAELNASGRDVRKLPLGTYEVQFSMREGSNLKTFVVKDVILRSDGGEALTVELNDAATTVVGGTMSVQQMQALIGQLQQQVSTLQQQVAALQK